MKVVIAGGGTGGHIAPAIAMAEEITVRYGRDSVHFLCGGNELERNMLGHAGYEFTALQVSRPRGTLRSKATTVISTALAVPAARRKLKEFQADVLLCVGGYASLPGAMAASLMRLPVFLMESNAVPGKVTRTIARFARACYAHMPLTRPLDCAVEVVGNPVRGAFLAPIPKQDARRALGLDPHLPTLLVMGGSQGAQAINDAAFAAAMQLGALREHMQVLHLTGQADLDKARSAWRASGLRHRASAFTHNTATWFSAADLALTRSGAGTISELLALAVPMALVPYPAAADDHQRANALWVAAAGAGVLIQQDALSPDRVLELARGLLLSQDAQSAASAAAAQLAQPEAAATILDSILARIGASASPRIDDSRKRAAA
ncbi:MAG: undecaprenyldiphospho-muramoylpentapeptide beta-N-acetylglucosaminyltransferase [Planctomycetes bacterium]|nr:undecaprenyldiphospho-muramoylpentapeptide beta-N-acetylglucosaminyltransferase [Planctomycetota bacterium]